VPPDPEDYVHRVGRTARAETTGTAITFINVKDQRKFMNIENLVGQTIEKLPLPSSIGDGPDYQPQLKKNTNFRKQKFGRPVKRNNFRKS
jgi:ATP-dependent RNA helicase RhlE